MLKKLGGRKKPETRKHPREFKSSPSLADFNV